MSVTELKPRAASSSVAERALSGWGRTSWSRCVVHTPQSAEEVRDALAASSASGRSVIARGAGRSYGDAAQNQGGEVLDMTGLDRVLAIDPERMLITAQAGATIAQLMARLYAHGLTLPVVPGTRHVTLAGAIASDIHGKNHHCDGGFARHVAALTLSTPGGEVLELTPDRDPQLFFATLGGMGLTGVVLEATLQVEPLSSPWVAEDLDRTDGLSETLELMSGREERRYSVAWLDLLAEGSKMGRALVSRAEPLAAGASPPPQRGRRGARGVYPGTLSKPPIVDVPDAFPSSLLRVASVRAFNYARWRSSPRRERGRPLALAPYFFPLDVLGEWNRLYGASGLVQYQFVIPAGEESALERCFELIRVCRLPVYLAVFKRFGAAFGGPLSFPLEGWTLAMDLPADAPGLHGALEQLDELVAECGGRVYLTKDSRLRAETLAAMYPQLERFQEQRARVDPEGLLRSDLGERVGLCGAQR
jgi:decaprenylphospho-beta-D-ribofuranose 2-oxidase